MNPCLRKLVLFSLFVAIGIGVHLSLQRAGGRLRPPLPPQPTVALVPLPKPIAPEPKKAPPRLGDRADTLPVRRLVHPSEPFLTPLALKSELLSDAAEIFQAPPEIESIVNFWKGVYSHYDTHHVMLHDSEFLGIQYGVLDFTRLDGSGRPEGEIKEMRLNAVKEEMGRIRTILSELDEADSRTRLSKEAKRIAKLFQKTEGAEDMPRAFLEAQKRLRSQLGLKNRFEEGIQRSGRYLPIFEEIFSNYGVPTEITRLVFVESLFRERALSSVGAAGLWQFMGDTAKRFMTVERLVDERYDPIVATHGAARLLLRNYELLGSWPLAINAYNSGPGNLLNAVKALGTKEIAVIIKNYRKGSYGFDSRNFYPCFLAALETYEKQEEYFGKVERDPLMSYEIVELPTTMDFLQIAYLSDMTLDEVKELNPAYAPTVFQGSYSLPSGSRVRITPERKDLFGIRLVDFYVGRERPLLHVVAPGDSLRRIAALYNISSMDLKQINGPKARLESGRILRIPRSVNMAKGLSGNPLNKM